jgi:hypothetical protein
MKRVQGGFTIIEALMGLAAASLLVLTALSLTTLSTQIIGNTKRYLVVNSLAFAKMQEYENKTFDNIAVGTAPDYEIEDFTSSLTGLTEPKIDTPSAKVYSEPISGSLRKLRVEITYKNGNTNRFIEYATYIQLGGVGR